MELIPDWAPNIHPMIVHFPIAFLFGAIGMDLLSLAIPKWSRLRSLTVGLYVLGGVAAVITYFTGSWAADVVSVPAEAQAVLTEHANLAWWTMWFFGIYALVRLGASLWSGDRYFFGLHGVLFVIALGGSYLLYETGDHGAEMVFRYGVGVTQADRTEQVAEPGLTVGASGWEWRPQSARAWTGEMQWLEGTPDTLQARLDTLGTGAVALSVTPQAPVMFVVPDTLGAVQVSAELNLDEFDGTVSLLHHVQDAQTYDFLSIRGGVVEQGRVSDGERTVMDEGSVDVRGWHTFRAVGDGTHFRGYLGGELVAHPHGEALPPGPVGLRLEGTGTVGLRGLSAEGI